MSASRRSSRALTTFAAVSEHVLRTKGRVAIHPNDNVLVGIATIKRYLGLRSNRAFYMLLKDHALPVFPRLDGRWATTCTLIDWWAFEQSQLAQRNGLWIRRRRSRDAAKDKS